MNDTSRWRKSLWDASKVYAPTLPRKVSNEYTIQDWSDTRGQIVSDLESASLGEMPGYYSVYAFPWGHSKQGNIPQVDCIFIDLDITKEHYNPKKGKTSIAGWRRDMSALLARARMIAETIIEENKAPHFRVVLSGHKGIHLYLDFPEVAPENGSFRQFKNGLRSYGDELMRTLNEMANGVDLSPWVDVDGSDLGRLARHPNTRHHGAQYDSEDRWCVPITVEELATLTVDDYLDLTLEPRQIVPEMRRMPSERAGQIVIQHIRTASEGRGSAGSSRYDPAAVKNYTEEKANNDVTLDDLVDPLIMGNKPCIMEFRNREDAYDHGEQSRAMELSIMGRFIEMGVPIDVMHKFFEVIPGYNEKYTDDLINDLIGRGLNQFNCENIAGTTDSQGRRKRGRAPTFCLGNDCKLYQRSNDIELTH